MEFLSNLRETAKTAKANIAKAVAARKLEEERVQAENERRAREKLAADINSCIEKLKSAGLVAEFKAYLVEHAERTGKIPTEWVIYCRYNTKNTFLADFDLENLNKLPDELIPSIERVISEAEELEGISIQFHHFQGSTGDYISNSDKRAFPFRAKFFIAYPQ